ncbi:hypothetical protein SAMD00019534_056480 [Acytostelium subglobosum LB1]|uniref:hypothetical protein n=1 Tax=Acytostelium subglobosum LB1 TaxID=1410327 RepID=UPI0006450D8F|nr:hypothetical protein SAMD00019534_056480 [Acytostelium subglobosum LB1]GAM22473.1 hypothetical protein SAMD00019534_056480 [Acytostelium subglobosum LB1]|eukprot:XP_012754593.1 hypothetical protein SAMD00019534_056480 [Acytostelium subglobosum LB1]
MKNEMIKLNDTKNKIKSCLGLIEQVQQPAVQHQFNNHIINMIDNGYSVLSLDTFKWTSHRNVLPRKVDHSSTATVYIRGHIYQFGGHTSPKRYTRISLADNKCHDANIVGVSGGSYISTCFDGDKYIYLVGGLGDIKRQKSVDRFNIDTLQFEHVGELLTPFTDGLHHHNNKLYLVESMVDGNNVTCIGYRIKTFDLLTRTNEILMEIKCTEYIESACFDGIDNFFVKTNEFHRVTLSSKLVTVLEQCPSFGNLMYDATADGVIFSIGGKNKIIFIQFKITNGH